MTTPQEIRTVIDEARARYRAAIAVTLDAAQQMADVFEPAIGEVSVDVALEAWRCELQEALRRASETRRV